MKFQYWLKIVKSGNASRNQKRAKIKTKKTCEIKNYVSNQNEFIIGNQCKGKIVLFVSCGANLEVAEKRQKPWSGFGGCGAAYKVIAFWKGCGGQNEVAIEVTDSFWIIDEKTRQKSSPPNKQKKNVEDSDLRKWLEITNDVKFVKACLQSSNASQNSFFYMMIYFYEKNRESLFSF